MKLRAGEISFWQQCVTARLNAVTGESETYGKWWSAKEAVASADVAVELLRDRLERPEHNGGPYRDPNAD